MADKTTNWTEAITRAMKHPTGQFSDTNGSTLAAMARQGVAEKLSDGKYYLTDEGWKEYGAAGATQAKPVAGAPAPKVEYKAMGHARWELPLDLPNGAPDTSHPEYPDYGTVRPNSVGLGLMINSETGAWEVTTLSVIGPKVKDGKVTTKRDYGVMFVDPMDEDSAAPEWVQVICREWTDRANGISTNSPARGDAVEPLRLPDAVVELARQMMQAARQEVADDIAFVGKASAEGRAHRPKFETGGFLNDCEWMEKVAREGRPEGIED